MKSQITPPTRPHSTEPQSWHGSPAAPPNTPVLGPIRATQTPPPMSPIDALPPTYEQVLAARQSVIQPRGPMLPPGGAQMADEAMLGRGMGRGRSL